jgi:hypothetical protein
MSPDLTVPSGIRLHPIPPYSPELQPAECVFPLIRESIANRVFPDLDALEESLIPCYRWLMDHPKIVQGEAGFGWIRQIESGTD